MNKGLIRNFIPAVLLLLPLVTWAEGEIWKVVDEDGNVTFTDQRPADGSDPMDLPELSVIQTEPPQMPAKAPAEDQGPSLRELRRQFSDFQITQPSQEETFWGTANTVVVAWGSSATIEPEMDVVLYVDGQPRDVESSGSLPLTLDRGEHKVFAELLDERKRKLATTETITFFVKQNSGRF